MDQQHLGNRPKLNRPSCINQTKVRRHLTEGSAMLIDQSHKRGDNRMDGQTDLVRQLDRQKLINM